MEDDTLASVGQQQLVEPCCHHLLVTCCLFSVSRYHLQALRHLYVLAAEPRLLVPVDVDTNTPCYALLEVTYKVVLSLSLLCNFITTHSSWQVRVFKSVVL